MHWDARIRALSSLSTRGAASQRSASSTSPPRSGSPETLLAAGPLPCASAPSTAAAPIAESAPRVPSRTFALYSSAPFIVFFYTCTSRSKSDALSKARRLSDSASLYLCAYGPGRRRPTRLDVRGSLGLAWLMGAFTSITTVLILSIIIECCFTKNFTISIMF